MKVIAGLGNPGQKYELTRHNVGFLFLDQLQLHWRFPPFKSGKKELLSEGMIKGEKVALIKPQTYMNLSGESVVPYCRFFKVDPIDLLVVHDDLDLQPMQLKLKSGGGTGGHNGLKSIEEVWGSGKNGYARLRIGIGKPQTVGSRLSPSDYVLGTLSKDEIENFEKAIPGMIQAVELWIDGKLDRAMNQLNQKIKLNQQKNTVEDE